MSVRGKSSQIVLEYMILTALGFVLLLVFTASFQGRYQDISITNERDHLEGLTQALEREILMAAKVETGYDRSFTLPEELAGQDYIIENTDRQIIIRTDRSDRSILIPEIRGTIQKGDNRIRNIGGIICLGNSCSDLTAPTVLASGPSGAQSGPTVDLTTTTDEDSVCKYGTEDTLYINLQGSLEGTGTDHSKTIPVSIGNYVYYVRCQDSAGNPMISSEVIIFNVV